MGSSRWATRSSAATCRRRTCRGWTGRPTSFSPVLHGQFGESGELLEILEHRRLPFVGSGSAASRLGMNKANTKVAWENAGLPTPRWLYVNADTFDPETGPEGLFAPCVVKAVDSGSSIDVFICKSIDAARN